MVTRRHFPFDQHSGTSARGQLRSRLICAHVGRPRSLLIFPKADITSFGSADRYGWVADISSWSKLWLHLTQSRNRPLTLISGYY